MGFASDLTKNIAAAQLEVNNKCYAVVDDLFISVVDSTRVLTGLLKNSWYPTDGPEASSEIGTDANGTGSSSVMRIDSLKQSEAFNGKDATVTMVNNIHYAMLRGEDELLGTIVGFKQKYK